MAKLTKEQKTGLGFLGALAAIFGIKQLTKAAPPWCCPYCSQCFATYEELVDHVKAEHPGERIPIPFTTQVYDAETFLPVGHALVSMGIFPDKTPVISSGYTNASGYWETGVLADTYRVTYSKSGYLDYDCKVDVYIGMPTLVTHLPPL